MGVYDAPYTPTDPFQGMPYGVPPEWIIEQYRLQQQAQADAAAQNANANKVQGAIGTWAGNKIKNYVGGKLDSLGSQIFGSGGSGATAGGMSSAAAPVADMASTLPATAEANAAFNAAAMGVPESQAAWNAAATEAGGGLTGATDAAGALGSYAPYLGGAAVLGGGYGLYNALKKRDVAGGAMGGAAIGGGLMALAPTLGLAAGPVGWGALGLAALLGGGMGAGATGLFGNKMRFKHEYERAQKLRDAGIDWGFNATEPTKGRSKADMQRTDLANDFVGFDPQKVWVNNKFNQSRNEGDLQAMDIQGYSFLPEILGNDYAKADLDTRLKIADAALKLGVREHTGEIDLADKANNDVLKQQAQAILAAKAAPQPAVRR